MGKSRSNKTKAKLANQGPLGGTMGFGNVTGKGKGGGGFGTVQPGAKTATGSPIVNPFFIPKQSGQNVGSWVYPSQYLQDWDVTRWREACNNAIEMGYTQQYATITTWVFTKSAFVQSLFFKLGLAMDKVQFYVNDKSGNELPDLTLALCAQPWQLELRREILYSYFWGFSGLNFDPIEGVCYKYPQQQIDPINRMLKANTFSFFEGDLFAENDNLLFVQPSNSYERFLGWMQPISCSYVEMNVNSNSWIAAGRRLAFPLLTAGYPQDDGSKDANGLPKNNYKDDAIALVSNIDPTQGLVYPYTLDNDGKIQKSIEIEFEKTGTSANAHKIYQEFNQDQKGDIQELVYGRSLTQASGKGGNRALGEVEERALDDRVAGLMPYILSVLNGDFRKKISKFYNNLPDGWTFGYNSSKQLTFADMQLVVATLNDGGFKPTDKFFEDNGISADFFEPLPAPKIDKLVKPDATFQMAQKKKLR